MQGLGSRLRASRNDAAKRHDRIAVALSLLGATLATLSPVRAAVADEGQAAPQELPEVKVISTSPVVGTGIPAALYPGNAQTISSKAISPNTNSLSDTINAKVGSANVNDTQGNPYQMDLNFRGYTASPVLGTPQGLSVYVDGVRVNEPFGDIVSWDLIPQIAIANITVIPGTNPVYGLNTLGGALAVNTKSGFAFPGARVQIGAGSFDERTVEAEQGGHEGDTDYYVATSFLDDNGWAKNNPSLVRQLFAKIGYQGDAVDLDWSIQYVSDTLGGNQLVAHSMLQDATSGYSHPDYSGTRSFVTNLTAKTDLAANSSIEGNIYYRNIWRLLYNSNVNDPVVPGMANQPAICMVLYGEACAGNVVSVYTQEVYGFNAQFSNHDLIDGHQQYFTAGLNTQYGRTQFNQTGQDAIVTKDYSTIGDDPFTFQSDIQSNDRDIGVYLTDTFVLSERASITASARQDHSTVSLGGTSIDENNELVGVTGSHSYQRLNPALGGTYIVAPQATLYANYAEGLRTPSAIELACADPVHPCAGVPSAFSSDPNLKAVVARSFEVGARGGTSDAFHWRSALFYSNLSNDILFNQSTLTTGFFSNVGRTRREGWESSVDGKLGPFDYSAAITLLEATFQSSYLEANGANVGSRCPGAACIPVRAGDKIPGIPQIMGKFLLGYELTAQTRLETLLQAQGSSFARGDENNLATFGKSPGFYTVKIDAVYQINKTFELSGGVSNLFNRVYSNFAMLSNNDLRSGIAENFLAVGQPRTFFAALAARF
jgi:outer membrane receptor protein involved in Fe transport